MKGLAFVLGFLFTFITLCAFSDGENKGLAFFIALIAGLVCMITMG